MLTINNCGLLIVDIQGKLASIVDNSDLMIESTIKLVSSCQLLSIPVIVLEQNPAGLGSTVQSIKASISNYDPLEKHSFNGISEAHIQKTLESYDKKVWLVAGIEAHICVYQTVQGLIKNGWEAEIVSDCISARRRTNVELALSNLKEIGARITSVEMCVYQLMQNSKIEKFRDILEIIK